jgi:hypothetical protein
MGLLRDGGNCVSCQSSPFEMAENCNSRGVAAALAATVRSCEDRLHAQAGGFFVMRSSAFQVKCRPPKMKR